MNKKHVLFILMMFSSTLFFNNMAMLSRVSQTSRRLPTSARFQMPAAVRATSAQRRLTFAPQARSYYGKPDGGQSWWQNLKSYFWGSSSTSSTVASQSLSQRLAPMAQSIAQKASTIPVVQQGMKLMEDRAFDAKVNQALLLIEKLRNRYTEVGKVKYIAFDEKFPRIPERLEADGDWFASIFAICNVLVGQSSIPRFARGYRESDKIKEALNQKLPGGRTILGHLFENTITSTQLSVANAFAKSKLGQPLSFEQTLLPKSDALMGISSEIGSLVRMGAELSEADIIILKDRFAELINKINSNEGKVYDCVVLARLVGAFDHDIDKIFNAPRGKDGYIIYNFTSSNGTVYKINEKVLSDIYHTNYQNSDTLIKNISYVGKPAINGEENQNWRQEIRLKDNIKNLPKTNEEIEAEKEKNTKSVRFL